MKKITILLGFLAIFSLAAIYFVRKNTNRKVEVSIVSETPNNDISLRQDDEEKEIKAAFVIFTNGTKRDFSALMYHNLSPDAFLTAENPNVITVKKQGVTWQKFFDTLPFELTKECLVTGTKQTFCTGSTGVLKFYLNGARDHDMLVREINGGDKALITFGPEEEPNLSFQLSQIPNPE